MIQYDGTRYSGWQSQQHTDQTIQGKLTKVLECMLGEAIDLQGSGRTDAGGMRPDRQPIFEQGQRFPAVKC